MTMHKKLLLILFSLLSLSAQAVEVLPQLNGQLKALDLKKVAACTAVIQKQMKKNKLARIGYATTFAATIVVGGWALWSGVAYTFLSQPDNKRSMQGTYDIAKENNHLLRALHKKTTTQKIEDDKAAEPKGYTLPAVLKVVTDYGGSLVTIALTSFLSGQMTGATNFALQPIFKAWDRVFHDANVQWFIFIFHF